MSSKTHLKTVALITKQKSMTILITGGLGFIGSNLAKKMVSEKNEVKIYDAKIDGYGANEQNISDIREDVNVIKGDIRNYDRLEREMEGVDVVYHLAAQLSRKLSNERPELDVNINNIGTLNVLRAASEKEDKPHVIYTSSQAVYGDSNQIPIDEKKEATPVDIYGANKLSGEKYMRIYNKTKDVPTTTVRLTNVYGPRAQLENPDYGVINLFIRKALLNETLTVFGEGSTKRDFVYVKDVVEALSSCKMKPKCFGEVYLLGSGRSITIAEMAETIVASAKKGKVKNVDWPEEWRRIKVGDIIIDNSKIKEHTKWKTNTEFKEGIQNTLKYYNGITKKYISL